VILQREGSDSIVIMTKGADNVMLPRLKASSKELKSI
jgi:hypothetical protein